MTKQLNRVTWRLGAGAGDDPAGRQEAEILHRVVEASAPLARTLVFRRGQRRRDATPGILDSPVDRLPAAVLRRYFMSQICWEMVVRLDIQIGSGDPLTLKISGEHPPMAAPAVYASRQDRSDLFLLCFQNPSPAGAGTAP